jgi:GTP cyclohydrolase IB
LRQRGNGIAVILPGLIDTGRRQGAAERFVAMNQMTDAKSALIKDSPPIPDTQSERDERHLAIQRVGVKDVRYPLTLRMGKTTQPSIGQWDMAVALPAEQKGTHMSRFVAWLDALDEPLDVPTLRRHFDAMLEKLHADEGRVEVRFPFFIRKRAPVSGLESLLDYQGSWIAEAHAGRTTVWSQVLVPVKSLCPCSKEISDYGAHNQRSHVTIRAELLGDVSWNELVRFAEESASSEIWPMLKRADEKWITEHAYENPKFVEDLVRDVALRLNADARIGRYSVDVENFESIHNHSAYARIERG